MAALMTYDMGSEAEANLIALRPIPGCSACGRDPFDLQHSGLGARSAWGREPTQFSAGGEHSMAGHDQRDRVTGHRLPNGLRGLGLGTQSLRNRSVSGCLTPPKLPNFSVDP